MKVAHIITGLSTGGAETMLLKLLSATDRRRFAPEVFSLTDIGPVGENIAALEVPVRALGMRRGAPSPGSARRLAKMLRDSAPDVVQTWMYHADLLGGWAAKRAGVRPIAWNIRNSTLDRRTSKRSTLLIVRLCARLSQHLPTRIVCCSEAAWKVHEALGYAAEKRVIIPNGFDLSLFRLDPAARWSVREELGVPESTPLIGLVARFDPQKDHTTFIKAAARLPDAQFVLCGDGIAWENAALADEIEQAGLRDHFHLLGRRQDIPRLTAALDIASSSSCYGEAFPNVVGEAMACGVPCVVTDVGDSALIVGETGRVVPPKDPSALANAWADLLAMDAEARGKLGQAARCRVQEHFNLPTITARYERLYEEMGR